MSTNINNIIVSETLVRGSWPLPEPLPVPTPPDPLPESPPTDPFPPVPDPLPEPEPPPAPEPPPPAPQILMRNMLATPDDRLYLACGGVNKIAIVAASR